MDAQSINPLLTTKIVGSYLRHHTVGASELPDLITSVYRALSGVGRQAPVEEVPTPPFRCASLCGTTTWSAWIAATGGKRYAATSVADMA
jgi:predicted transcriptional regulator